MNEDQKLDQSRKDAFAGRMIGLVNDGFLALMVSVGHRTGLFDTMARLTPATSDRIASEAGLQERYVREWLGAMVVGRIVDYEPEAKTYVLPREHAASLTRESGLDNIAPLIRLLPMTARVEDQIVDCFRHGGGVPYTAYAGFAEAMHETSAPMLDACLLDVILPMVPDMTPALERGSDVLEVGCGTGHALNLMAGRFSASRFLGYDLVEENIARAQATAGERRLANVRFEVKDVAGMSHADRFDLVTAFDTIHDQARPDVLLSGIARALKPGGTFLMSDIQASSRLENNLDHPLGVFGYGVSCMHCMTVSLAYDGMGLGAMWGEEKAKEMIEAAGLELIDVKQTKGDPLNTFYVARKR
jgi:SAM-dependent methyltransferase